MLESPPRFDWSQIRGIEVEPYIIYRGTVAPRTRHLTERRPYLTWWRVLRGSVTVTLGGQRWLAGPGQWIFLPGGAPRTHDFTDDAEIYSICFDARWAGGIPLLRLAEPLIAPAEAHPRLLAGAETLLEAVEEVCGPDRHAIRTVGFSLPLGLEFRACLDAFATALLEVAFRHGASIAPPSGDDARLNQILDPLRAEVRAGPLPYDQWTRLTGLSRTQIDRLAQAHLHMSLRAHRDHLLMAEASRRLAADLQPIKRIAADLGFVDTAHFCRWLRQHTGQSPLALRKHAVA